MISVALPVWNSKKIAWLCMESLCRQKTTATWELIVFEERHEAALGKDFYDSYIDRLKKAGCVNLTYLTRDDQLALSEKWQIIAQKCSKKSNMMCLCAADNYYHPYMIQDSEDAYKKGHDWFYTIKGYFLNFKNGKIVIYDRPVAETGLQMAISAKLARKLPPGVKLYKNIDRWTKRHCNPKNPLIDKSDHWQGTLCTHGYNNISVKRDVPINGLLLWFFATDKTLKDIVPEDIVEQIKGLCLNI